MTSSVAAPPRAGRPSYWAALAIVGMLATAAGVVAPQLLPGASESAARVAPTTSTSTSSELQYAPPAWPEPPSVKGLLVRLALGTVVVLGLSVATLWYGRRWLQPPADALAGRDLRLVETLNLGNRCCLHLVQLASRQILVGADAGGIRTVVPVDNFEQLLPEPPEAPTAAASPTPVS